VLYRKHSGAGTVEGGMVVTGVFLIQRLEGSRFGIPTLWVLNEGTGGEGWVGGESIAGSYPMRSW
jgi:hypothetical protein